MEGLFSPCSPSPFLAINSQKMRSPFCDRLLIVSLVAFKAWCAYSLYLPATVASPALFLPPAVLYASASSMQQLKVVSPSSETIADIDGKRHKYLLAIEKLWTELPEWTHGNIWYAIPLDG